MLDPQTTAWLATFCIGASYIFQIIKARNSRKLGDVSWWFLSVISLGNLLWILYGWQRQDMTFFYANIVIGLLILVLILMKARFQVAK